MISWLITLIEFLKSLMLNKLLLIVLKKRFLYYKKEEKKENKILIKDYQKEGECNLYLLNNTIKKTTVQAKSLLVKRILKTLRIKWLKKNKMSLKKKWMISRVTTVEKKKWQEQWELSDLTKNICLLLMKIKGFPN